MENFEYLKDLINNGKVDEAIEQLNQLIDDDSTKNNKDYLFYLRGNGYRKKGDWKRALDNYQHAIDLNPQSPASEARTMMIDILDFYHKDMYNQ